MRLSAGEHHENRPRHHQGGHTTVRDRIAKKALEMRRQGFFGAAMLPMSELEYTGITEKLKKLVRAFRVRA